MTGASFDQSLEWMNEPGVIGILLEYLVLAIIVTWAVIAARSRRKSSRKDSEDRIHRQTVADVTLTSRAVVLIKGTSVVVVSERAEFLLGEVPTEWEEFEELARNQCLSIECVDTADGTKLCEVLTSTTGTFAVAHREVK